MPSDDPVVMDDMNELDMLPPAGVGPRDIEPGVVVPGPVPKSA